MAAPTRPEAIFAIVSRGGRPDLADNALLHVKAPTLLLVGENDPVVLQLNQQAMTQLKAEKHLQIIPGATHLFEEPGTLVQVAQASALWFQEHFMPPTERGPHLKNLDEEGNIEEIP